MWFSFFSSLWNAFDRAIPKQLDRCPMKGPSIMFFLIGLSLVLFGCSNQESGSAEALKTFTVKGIVRGIDDEGRTLVIKHEEMPGYMGAMTMPFRVKAPSQTEGLAPGDEIIFTYQVAELSSWIEAIQPTGTKVELPPLPGKADQSSHLLKAGDLFPGCKLINENGETIRLEDYRGSVIALTFIFTRCPVPEYCPTMMRNFKEVDALLKADPEGPENYRLLTVSFDSEHDTPEVMKAYGKQFGQSSKNWNLLTSPQQEDIKSLGEAVGLMFGKTDNAIYSHNLRTVVLDASGKITKIFTDESWKPEALVKELKSAENAWNL
jgi:protein SCO1/2